MRAEDMGDDELLEEMMYWARVSRNENGLPETDHKFFQSVLDEIKIRGLLDKKNFSLGREN
jgi:hypothetical protein